MFAGWKEGRNTFLAGLLQRMQESCSENEQGQGSGMAATSWEEHWRYEFNSMPAYASPVQLRYIVLYSNHAVGYCD
jgi:hypothetical protein